MTPTPPADPDVTLHSRLQTVGDPAAAADFAAAYLDMLVAFLRRAHRTADEHLVLQAAEDAVLDVISHPGRYNPGRGSLPGYLRMAARRDLMNAVRKEDRHQQNRAGAESVEFAEDRGNDEGDSLGPSFDDPKLAAALADFTPTEQEFFRLLRTGEKRTSVLAAALGLGDRPVAEQQAETKRTRDRLIKRLQRAKEGT